MTTCPFCNTPVERRSVEHIHRWGGEIRIMRNVPADVCVQCGQTFFGPDAMKAMDAVAAGGREPDARLSVPVYSLRQAEIPRLVADAEGEMRRQTETLDIRRVMDSLSERHPIFHSEADFQHALAWRIHEMAPGCQVRLEFNPFPKDDRRSYLDIWLPDLGIALELKYRTRGFETEYMGEKFALRNHSAQDHGRYDFLKDVQRLERVAREMSARAGYAIMLTNDSSYWNAPLRGNTVDAAFRIHEGSRISGELNWASHASKGTMRGRESAIRLTNAYAMRWQDYSKVADRGYATFRYLAVSVAA